METAQLPGETTRETSATSISVPYGDATVRHLHLAVGACRLIITPGYGEDWVTGRYYGPTEVAPLEINQSGGEVKISQKYDWAEMVRLFDGPPVLELRLGAAVPYSLSIDTGASDNQIDLGGLPLTRFALKQGAGRIRVDFSAPNPAQMDRLDISSGASSIEMENLANANFAEMRVEGGAASYKLDFGGRLQRDAQMKLTAAMSSTNIAIPANTAAKISSQSVMGGLEVGDGFMRKDGAFWTQAALAGIQPVLSMQISLTMGALELMTRYRN